MSFKVPFVSRKNYNICQLEFNALNHRCSNHFSFPFIAECCPSDMKNYLIEFVLEDVVFMSGHKYSSNVVEKCIGVATPLQKEQAMDLICSHPPR